MADHPASRLHRTRGTSKSLDTPGRFSSSKPRISARNVADSRWSRTATMVWFSWTAMATSRSPRRGVTTRICASLHPRHKRHSAGQHLQILAVTRLPLRPVRPHGLDHVGQDPSSPPGQARCVEKDHFQRRSDSPRRLAGLLAQHFTVYPCDRRGRGDSGDTPLYAADREIEDRAAVIDATGGSAHVFGHSSGAVLALEAAVPDAGVTRLALYEPPLIVD